MLLIARMALDAQKKNASRHWMLLIANMALDAQKDSHTPLNQSNGWILSPFSWALGGECKKPLFQPLCSGYSGSTVDNQGLEEGNRN